MNFELFNDVTYCCQITLELLELLNFELFNDATPRCPITHACQAAQPEVVKTSMELEQSRSQRRGGEAVQMCT